MISQRDIVLLSFPFSDLKSSKVRPAIVLSKTSYNKKHEDFVAVPLTTNLRKDQYSLVLTDKELESGHLIVDSRVKVDRIFSVSKKLARIKIGKIRQDSFMKIKDVLLDLLS